MISYYPSQSQSGCDFYLGLGGILQQQITGVHNLDPITIQCSDHTHPPETISLQKLLLKCLKSMPGLSALLKQLC